MKKYLAEFLGTFAIVFCGTGAIIINEEMHGVITHPGIAITFGLIVMAMIYSFGELSGAHFNPAVTVAFTVADKFPLRQVLPYLISQLSGALTASFILSVLFPLNVYLGATMPSGSDLQSLILEFVLAFFLMLVIMNVAHGSKEQGMFAGLAIGGIVLLEAMFAGPVSGASMNPARSIAPALVSGHLEHLWVYILAPIMGTVASVYVWKYLSGFGGEE